MEPTTSIEADKPDREDKAEQTSAQSHSEDVASDQRFNVLVQNVLLIWLDNSIDDNSTDCRNTIAQLRCTVNSVNTFTDVDQCVDFVTDICGENVCMIISSALYQNILPLIHDLIQLHAIFIFSKDKTEHDQSTEDWPKIKGLFTEISPICEALKQVAEQCEQNAISMSVIATNDGISKQNLHQLDPSFMYTQILKKILLTINFEQKHITEYIDYCRDVFAENQRELRYVKKFESKYRNETPIWWYTYECFLYPMLNRALRIMDANIIIKLGFFICDLHRHLEQLHKEQFSGQNSGTSFLVYRGQGISKIEFEKISKTEGGLISFNNFLSTSKNHTISLGFANRAMSNPDLVGVLFVITIDPSESTTPFASITNVSFYKGKEDEVLFAMNTVFRIGEITSISGNHRLFQVKLTLTSDNDKDLQALTNRIQNDTYPDEEGWWRLAAVLIRMGQFSKAEEIYKILLDQTINEDVNAGVFHELGMNKCAQGEYKQATIFYEKSIEITLKTIPLDHLGLASSTSAHGNAYQGLGDYQKALSLQQEALQIYQNVLPRNHPNLAISYGNIGSIYGQLGDYSKARSCYEKVLEIQQQSPPSNHRDLAMSYNNIGNGYHIMGEHWKALSFHEKALEIRQQSLPSNHPHLAESYNNIGLVYYTEGEYSKAISFHEKALAIRQ